MLYCRDMSSDDTDQQQQIDELTAALALPLPPAARAQIEAALAYLRATGNNLALGAQVGRDLNQGMLNLDSQARIDGVAVAVNLGTIVYGRPPEEDERRHLAWYLGRLAGRFRRLPLRGLDTTLDETGEGLALSRVYIELATTSESVADFGSPAQIAHYFRLGANLREPQLADLLADYSPDWVLPSAAITRTTLAQRGTGEQEITLRRQRLAAEAARTRQRLVLLGDPGSGKSTFIRYLALALAQRGLDHPANAALSGWEVGAPLLPVLLPLRKLAGKLHGRNQAQAIHQALRDEIASFGIDGAHALLNAALESGAALLLFDGLDEVPTASTSRALADRLTALQAVQAFAHEHPQARVLVTCRTRAFDERLQRQLSWPTETLAPLTLGQIRAFTRSWYSELVATAQIDSRHGARLGDELLAAIEAASTLRAMADTPLLLTMMALVLYHDGSLPRDRPRLYERVLDLLLGQWDKVRDGQSIAEAIGQPNWDSRRIQPALDQLSYTAHETAASADGRGRLARRDVRDTLIRFFEEARLPDAWGAAGRCLEYVDQRSGLLVPESDETYVFAHLTLQEHCAGRSMVRAADALDRLLFDRHNDRWHEPLLLGLGVAQEYNPSLVDHMLSELLDRDERGHPKPPAVRQRDVVLAGEIGFDRDWNYLRTQGISVDRHQRDLRRGLLELLRDRKQPLEAARRIQAGRMLGALGDNRIPVTPDGWRREIERAQEQTDSRRGRGYFCRVEPGVYQIGSKPDDPDASPDEWPQHPVAFDTPFWIGRFPITNAQWQQWVVAGGIRSHFANEPGFDGPNQPVVGVEWAACNAFCTWLSNELGATIRLPSEAEWEAAARGRDARRYPWGEGWQQDRAATTESDAQSSTVAVGSYPAGAAACGALDMAGNVSEWVADVWHSYPGAPQPFADVRSGVLRGGLLGDQISARCAARTRSFFVAGDTIGLRVVLTF